MDNFILYDLYTTHIIEMTMTVFADGEIKYFCPQISDTDSVLLVGSCYPLAHIETLYMIMSAIHRANPSLSVHYLLPYIPYCRQDKPNQNTSAGLEVVCQLLSSLPFASITVIHPHCNVHPFFTIPVYTIDLNSIIVQHIQDSHMSDIVVVSPDQGASHFVEQFTRQYGYAYVICSKYRTRDNIVSETILDPKYHHLIYDKMCFIIDDIYDTGGTVTAIANMLTHYGAKDVQAWCTHGLCNGNRHTNLDHSSLSKLFVTNTVVHSIHKKICTIDIIEYAITYARQYILSHH